MTPWLILASALSDAGDAAEHAAGAAQASTEAVVSRFEFGRIQSTSDWIVPIGALALALLLVRLMYSRDAAELPGWLGWLLTLLRTAAFVGLLIFYLQPQWRSEREIVYPSRVALLVDTSMSMNRVDSGPGESHGGATRLQQVADALDQTDFLARLRRTHEVVVATFNNSLERDRIVKLDKAKPRTVAAEAAPADDAPAQAAAPPPVAWRTTLEPRGTETRLGEAIEQLVRDQWDAPLSGVVVMSDGGQNAGVSPEAGIELARQARMAIFTVGVGSERKPASARVYDFKVPARAYPGDRYTVTGFIQGYGMPGRTVTVDLLAREGPTARSPASRGKGDRVAGRQVTLGADGEVVPVTFELLPDKTGRRTLCLRVQPPPGSPAAGDADLKDKFMEAEVEIVDHKNHVLLLAGGPSRDYQFLHTLLFRDRSTTLDILLQTGQPGMSQEAAKVLDEFPSHRDTMYDYDCIVAMDPNWQAIRPEQVELLENWIGDQGGGLIAVGGAAYLGRAVEGWVQDPEMAKIRNLYPVEFHRYIAAQGNTTYAAKEPWPLEFTREGLEAESLWLGDTAAASQAAWAQFPGVYGFCPVRGPKPGAIVLARFSDPRTAQAGRQPVYFAEHFYGSGRVFYMGSGEIWRLRRVDPTYFDQFYTKLIRHVSQGRLLRQSSRGVLLVGQDHYLVGNTVEVRAQLTNSKIEPLNLPSVALQVSHDGVMQKPVTLAADPSRAGTYLGQFPVLQEGEYRLDLLVPESREEHLTRSIRAVVPKLEEENPQRNAALLGEIAAKTGGAYYADLSAAVGSTAASLVDRLKDASRTELVPVAPKPETEERWLRWLLIGLASVLCLEWLIRRLAKLA